MLNVISPHLTSNLLCTNVAICLQVLLSRRSALWDSRNLMDRHVRPLKTHVSLANLEHMELTNIVQYVMFVEQVLSALLKPPQTGQCTMTAH